jgi:hypothetical protein
MAQGPVPGPGSCAGPMGPAYWVWLRYGTNYTELFLIRAATTPYFENFKIQPMRLFVRSCGWQGMTMTVGAGRC